MQSFLFHKPLTKCTLLYEAHAFASRVHEVNAEGPVIGQRLEKLFMDHLDCEGYMVEQKVTCDFEHLNIDLKCLQVKGKRGGAAKIHGYSKLGVPDYSILMFLYSYREGTAKIEDIAFVPKQEVEWVQAQHFLWSVPDGALSQYIVKSDEVISDGDNPEFDRAGRSCSQ